MRRWTETAKRRAGYAVVGVAVVLAIGAIVFGIRAGDGNAVTFVAIVVPAFLVAAILAMRAQPSNGAVWAFAGAGFFGAASSFGSHLAAARMGLEVSAVEDGNIPGSPADYDLVSALGVNVSLWAWIPSVFLLATLFLILFPDGRAPSRGWRWAAWVAAVSMLVLSVQGASLLAPWQRAPYEELLAPGEGTTMAPPIGFLMMLLMAIAFAAVVRLARRYRRATGEERLQYRWVTWAVGLYVVIGIFLFGVVQALGDVGGVLNALLLANIPLSIGVAITKHRLYDVDIVISRSLVFVGLAGFITVVYAGVVVGIGSLFEGSSVGLSVAAIALVAVVFEPVRHRLQRWVNRLVYGQRATPYEVLSDLTGRWADTETEEGLLDRMAIRLAEGTGAERAVVWVADNARFRAAAVEPAPDRPLDPVAGLEEVPGTVVTITNRGEVLGALSVEKRRGDLLNTTELRLVEDLAGSTALFLARRLLDAQLEDKARQLADSRRRLLDAQDVERRRLEQQLIEGPHQRVVDLAERLAAAARLAAREGSETAADLVQQVVTDAYDALEQIRGLAQGIYPPVLQSDGLPAAVRAIASHTPVAVDLDLEVPHRYDLPIEAAVYFCISEAITNAAKHGEGPIMLSLSGDDAILSFEVSDDGPGFDPETVVRGAGLDNMADRLDALGGTLTVTTQPGQPTTISGDIPVNARVPA